MKDIDELLMTFAAAAVMVSPFATLRGILAPANAHTLVWTLAGVISEGPLAS